MSIMHILIIYMFMYISIYLTYLTIFDGFIIVTNILDHPLLLCIWVPSPFTLLCTIAINNYVKAVSFGLFLCDTFSKVSLIVSKIALSIYH